MSGVRAPTPLIYEAELADAKSAAAAVSEEARQQAEVLRSDLQARAETEISEMLDRPQNWLGNAPEQAQYFVEQALAWTRRFPDSNSLEPEPLL